MSRLLYTITDFFAEGSTMANELLDCEHNLRVAIKKATESPCPPQLAQALEYAVFPGGARVRPKLCLAVALATGNDDPMLAMSAAVAIEMLHCASLVHDDLPCFDDATQRRGKPSVHASFGERIAVLTGDTLIVSAFEQLARCGFQISDARRLATVTQLVTRGVGAPQGICAGQAWECEPSVDTATYHQCKTGALFVAATCAGAAAAGEDYQQWLPLGSAIGQAYQVADDIQDCVGVSAQMGKPSGRDALLGRPNAVHELGLGGAITLLNNLLNDGIASIPQCAGRDLLVSLVEKQSERFFPSGYKRCAA
jgi:geranylgeranyl diphosphate synthase, type II